VRYLTFENEDDKDRPMSPTVQDTLDNVKRCKSTV